MLGLVPLAAALAITAGQVDLAATVSAEGRAGEAPLAFGQPPEPSLMAIVTPGAQLLYQGPRLSLQADYQLRIFWRTVENEPVPAPLFLHMVGLTLTSRETRRLSTKVTASAYEGSADYTFLPVIFGAGQAALVTVPRLFSVALMGNVEERATRRVTPEIAFQATHNQPLGPAQVVAGTSGMTALYNLPHYTSAGVTPAVGIRLSPVIEATLSTDVRYQYVSGLSPLMTAGVGGAPATNTLSIGILVPTVGTTVSLARRTRLDLKVGVAFTHFFSGVPMNPSGITPDVLVDLKTRVFGTRRTQLDLSGTAAIEYYVDPVLAIAAPRGTAAAGGQLRFATDWSIGLQGIFSTALSAHPLPTLPAPTYPDEVSAAVNLPVRHPINQNVMLEFGGRWGDRSPFYTAPDFGFHQRQLWVYVLVTGTTHATRTVGSTTP